MGSQLGMSNKAYKEETASFNRHSPCCDNGDK